MNSRVGFIKKLWTTIVLIVLFSCSSGNDVVLEEVVTPSPGINNFIVELQVLSNEQDITTRGKLSVVSLFVFDSDNHFIEKVDVGKNTILNRRPVELSYPGIDSIRIVAWGGLQGVDVASMKAFGIISNLTVSLKHAKGLADMPGDLFFGQVDLSRPRSESEPVMLTMVRKTSALNLLVVGIPEKFGTTEGVFSFRLKCSYNVYDYKGELTGDAVEYVIPAYVDAGGDLSIDKAIIFPTSCLEIRLYRNAEEVFSVSRNEDGDKIEALVGEQLGVLYDLSDDVYMLHESAWDTIIQFL